MGLLFENRRCRTENCAMSGFCRVEECSLIHRQDQGLPKPVNRHNAHFDSCTDPVHLRHVNGRLWSWFCSLLLTFALLAGGNAAYAAAGSAGDEVAALVNGTVISRTDFQRELSRMRRQQGTRAKLADEAKLAELQREALENLITRELLYQESRKRGIAVAASAVDKELKELKGQFATGAQYSGALAKTGLDEAKVRGEIERGLAIRNLVTTAIGSRISVSERELKEYYTRHIDTFTDPPQVRISHILAKFDEAAAPEAKESARLRLQGARKRLTEGEDFARVAGEISDCDSKAKGGDLGWFSAGQLAPVMEKTVDGLKIDELSGVVEDRFGYHLVKVVERRPAKVHPYDAVADRVKRLARQEKGLKDLQPFVKKLRDGAKVEIVLNGDGR